MYIIHTDQSNVTTVILPKVRNYHVYLCSWQVNQCITFISNHLLLQEHIFHLKLDY